MSNLFKYLYNQPNDTNNDTNKYVDECINKNINNTLCNNLYGDYIKRTQYPTDSSYISYRKQVFYEKSPPKIIWFSNRYGHMQVYCYKNNNTIIKYCYYKKSLYVYSVHYTHLTIYIFENVYHRGIPYNINKYSSKIDKFISMNTKTKRYRITD